MALFDANLPTTNQPNLNDGLRSLFTFLKMDTDKLGKAENKTWCKVMETKHEDNKISLAAELLSKFDQTYYSNIQQNRTFLQYCWDLMSAYRPLVLLYLNSPVDLVIATDRHDKPELVTGWEKLILPKIRIHDSIEEHFRLMDQKNLGEVLSVLTPWFKDLSVLDQPGVSVDKIAKSSKKTN